MAEQRRTCAACGTANEEDARFCEGCGGSLARVCATCGVEANATARFCRGCGAPLDGLVQKPDPPAANPVRKTVTVMFADLAGSTSFEEKVDAETAREVIGRYHELLRSTAQRYRAGVTKYIGDGFMAVWGVPEIGPDDAAHAVDAGVELQEHFVDLAARVAETHGVELALRVAVNTGEVVVGAGDADLVGDALNVGARLEAECPRGRVVVGEETWRSTRGRHGYEALGQVQVKGRTAPVAVYQWLGQQSESADTAPFVGRTDEVRRLTAVLDDAVAAGAARMATVIGDPGVGKSRLAAEFTAAQADARVIEARCDVEGTVALTPIVEVLRARELENDVPASTPERDRLLRDLNGLVTGVPGSVEENFWALRRFVEVLASEGPVLFILDDIQWADTLLLDFIEHLVEWVQEVPVLVLALARPELREMRPDLVTVSRWVSAAVHLDGLDAGATAELAAKVLGATALPDELLRRLPSSTGGNPLFVRELIGMLAHDGVLVEQPSGWRLTIDVDAISIPPTIHALLASRLERLDAADRRVLEIASVVGSDFSPGALAALSGGSAAGVMLSLSRLRRLELAQPSGAYVGDEPVWRFHHVLIRDVAYRRLLKSDRADLHERLADWVEAGEASAAFDADETIARHLEAAHTYRLELGTVDEHTRDLALRSARRYAASARRALDRDELVSAGTQAARGAALAAEDDAAHAELLLIGCEAFLSAGDVAAGAPLVDELDRIAGDALAPWATCYRCQFVVYTDPERLLDVDDRLQSAIDEFGRRNDSAGLAKAHRVRAGARARLGRIGDCEVDLFEALIAARRSGDHRQITAALGAAPGAALWGPSPVPKAGGRCLDVVRMQRMTTAAPSLEATSLRCLAVLEMLRGRPDKARAMLADARQVVADLGLRHGLMETELFAGIIESMEGDLVAAEPHFRTALEGLDALGVGADAGQAAALLARSVLAQGRVDEADRYATESEHLAGRNLKTAIAWRAVRGEILAAQGRHDEAAVMAREAVTVATGTDLVLDNAEACLALSRVLAAAGDAKGANAARSDAERCYAAKEVASAIRPAAEPAISAVPAPTTVEPRPTEPRLAVVNQASETLDALWQTYWVKNLGDGVASFSDRFSYDDRRRLSGDPVEGAAERIAAAARAREQYPHSQWRTLAVRGEQLELRWLRLSDDAGNESTTLNVHELDGRGQLEYWARFDEDDFEGAYRELDRRYRAGEGVAFAEGVAASTEVMFAINQGDFDRLVSDLLTPGTRVENHTRSGFPDRSPNELLTGFRDLSSMVASARTWASAMRWLSPTVGIIRLDREAVGSDGEDYAWTRLVVVEASHGRLGSMCEFEVEDGDAAFAYAEERVRASVSRLAVTNRASQTNERAWQAMRDRDIDALMTVYADRFVFDDRRRLSGDPVESHNAMRAAATRVLEQYTQFEVRVLAVRGECLELSASRWSDDAGNQTAYLHVREVGDDDRVVYDARFDDDDFEGAYRELEKRYYAGEGAAFAEAGPVSTEAVIAITQGDFDRLFGEIYTPQMRIENRSRSAFPDRSATDLHASFTELHAMVASARTWLAAVRWLSPVCCVSRLDREALGKDGEQYTWIKLLVAEIHDGRITSQCQFEPEDKDAAFAYAEERILASASRLSVANRASERGDVAFQAMRARDLDTLVALYADGFVYDDRRRLHGDPIEGHAALRRAAARIVEQYPNVEWRTLAVRGERLVLTRTRWSDDAGNETTHLCVSEVGDDGRTIYDSRFDEDDFEGAYRELENRYFAAEGAAFAEVGARGTKWILDVNRGDIDSAFDDYQDAPVENRSSSTFPDPTISEPGTSFRNLNAMVASTRTWISAECWLSPGVGVARLEREAIGRDGEQYAWTWLLVSEFRDGRPASSCLFDLDDEDAAIAYAEERKRASSSRLAVRNQASQAADATMRAVQDRDIDRAVASLSDRFVYDDRRRFSGDPIVGPHAMRHALQRLLEAYPHVEWRTLAVRGQRLDLRWSRWWDDDGNEATYLTVFEADDDGRIEYHGRFDGEAFDKAYRELERRYYAGEGAAFAEAGAVEAEYMIAFTRGDLDRMSRELTDPAMRFENRSSSAFPDRSAAEFRASAEELTSMVSSMRTWNSAVCWLSPACCVSRFERDAIGKEGEQFHWLQLIVAEFKNGRVTAVCQFDPEDEDAAFAHAEERIRATTSRLAVANRASQSADALAAAMRTGDVDRSIGCFAERFVDIDRRRINGEPIRDATELRMACERIRAQYNKFEGYTLAVRGESLSLAWTRWSNDSGYETTHLFVNQVGDDGQITCQVRFDEDAFEEAYRDLEHRYYAGEGAAFAEAGAFGIDYLSAYDQGDFDRMLGELTAPGMQFENRSRSVFPDRSIAEFRASIEELSSMVSSSRTWISAICWVSTRCCVTRFEREAISEDGEQYKWAWIYVNEIRDGLVARSCKFDLDDEDAAFAYAEERLRAATSRLEVTNRACATTDALAAAMRARDIDDVMRQFSDRFVYDDRRRLSGNPIGDVREAMTRIMEQYSSFESHTLAVRGERLHLFRGRWSNPAGFETVKLHLQEIENDGRIAYEARFDEDDFDGAFRELIRRYHAGEGAEYAEAGDVLTDWIVAVNQGDLDRAFGELMAPNFRLTNRSKSVFGDRSGADLRSTTEKLDAMVASSRIWWPSACWLSPHWVVQRLDREAVGLDGETYSWTYIDVGEVRDGQIRSACRFDAGDEDAAFAYAEERMRAIASRLAVTNRASQMTDALGRAFESADVDRAMACYAVDFVYDDRRRLTGDPVRSRVDLRMGMERILAQYNKFDLRALAVRGERVQLSWSRWSDNAGNQTAYLHVREVGDDGLFIYDGRFDEDDFDGAYRELEHRYYTGEGAAFTEWGALAADWIEALNHGDFDRLFGQLTSPEMRAENRSRSAFPDRSTAETRSSLEELNAMVASVRTWNSAVCPLSPNWAVSRQEREAVGHDGEQYRWVRLTVGEIRDGRIASGCQFEVDDEDAAFAYAEERMRATPSRLAVTNRASQTWDAIRRAGLARDFDGLATWYSSSLVYDDHRRLSGLPIGDMGTPVERIMEQYSDFEMKSLAVRGDRLQLGWSRFLSDAGFESISLWVHEVGDDGRLVYQGRYDEEDFESAYRDLEQRYYAREGAASADAGATLTEYATALTRGDLDRVFGELTAPGFRVENRSRSAFPDRSAAELRASAEELLEMVDSTRSWYSASRWVSPAVCVARNERDAVGRDGEQYSWTRLHVAEVRDGKVTSACAFDLEDEDAAFAYAEERVRAASSRLGLTNRASQRFDATGHAARAGDVDAMVAGYAEEFVYDDRRRLSGRPLGDLRSAVEGILAQYNQFEGHTLAVRGDRLHLAWSRWSNESGFETNYLIVHEVDDDGRIAYEGRFDEDDFEGAYRELTQKYCAGEGAAVAELAALGTEWLLALNRRDFDRAFSELTEADARVENRSSSPFPDRSAAELRATFEDLYGMVKSARSWNSAECWLSSTCGVTRHEREAVGNDGEQFAWARLYVFVASHGKCSGWCEFDVDDEASAFAYAEQRVRDAEGR